METKLVRENRKMKMNMRLTTVAVAALLVVLAGSGIAGAAVITMTVDYSTTNLVVGGTTHYMVYGSIASNTWTNNPAQTFYGGIKAFKMDMVYSGTAGAASALVGGSKNVVFNTIYGAPNATQPTLVAGDTNGYLGIRGAAGAQAGFVDGQDYLTTDPDYSARYTAGNPLGAYTYVAGKGVLLYEGDIKAVAVGSVTVTTNWITTSSRIYTLGTTSPWNMLQSATTAATSNVTVLTILADNTAPHDAAIPGGNVGEKDWNTSSGGWNDLGHWVEITATAKDDGKPEPPALLTYEWTMTKPGAAPLIIAGKTSASLHLTLADIASLGLPPYVGVDDPSYHWGLSVRASDSALWSGASAPIDVFVPEPATMGLLSFGIVGALLRRRRRA